MSLTSNAFESGQPIGELYSCDGRNISPPLAWAGAPDDAQSLAITIDDTDAPGGTFRHWAVYDIPPNLRDLPAGAGRAGSAAFKQGLNDGGKPGYAGMCPPKGKGVHHYHFHLFALDVAALDLPEGASVKQVEKAAEQHQLATAELVGTFARD